MARRKGALVSIGSQDAAGLFGVLKTLFAQCWESDNYDERLRHALIQSFAMLRIEGIVSHIASRDVTLSCFLPEYETKEFNDCLHETIQNTLDTNRGIIDARLRSNPILSFRLTDKLSGIIAIIAQAGVTMHEASHVQPDFCVMVYRVNGKWRRQWHYAGSEDTENIADEVIKGRRSQAEEKFTQFHGSSTLAMLFHVMLYRESRFAPFPGKISERYWTDSIEAIKAPDELRREDALYPPWSSDEMRRTATLSFDLRKSTFCMEQADDPKKFGNWLDELVEILTRVCHSHGGVFDKFTGDGALVHFLDRECKSVYKTEPVAAAMDCAVDMHRAIQIHLKRLRQFLRMDSQLLGAGIAIDISDTYWALDHRGNPITVGRGVVGACRLCDKAEANRVHMTNIAFQELDQGIKKKLPQAKPIYLESKELNKDMLVTVWEFIMPSAPPELELGKGIDEICDQVYVRGKAGSAVGRNGSGGNSNYPQ